MRPGAIRTFALLACAALLAGCSGATHAPPEELSGLWSAGPAACAAGMGLAFEEGAIQAVYPPDERETLFLNPTYLVSHRGGRLQVRIEYDLPRAPDGARTGAKGVLVIERRDDGWIRPVSHRLEDRRTGAVRLRIGEDPLALALTVRPCSPNAWIANLRGRA